MTSVLIALVIVSVMYFVHGDSEGINSKSLLALSFSTQGCVISSTCFSPLHVTECSVQYGQDPTLQTFYSRPIKGPINSPFRLFQTQYYSNLTYYYKASIKINSTEKNEIMGIFFTGNSAQGSLDSVHFKLLAIGNVYTFIIFGVQVFFIWKNRRSFQGSKIIRIIVLCLLVVECLLGLVTVLLFLGLAIEIGRGPCSQLTSDNLILVTHVLSDIISSIALIVLLLMASPQKGSSDETHGQERMDASNLQLRDHEEEESTEPDESHVDIEEREEHSESNNGPENNSESEITMHTNLGYALVRENTTEIVQCDDDGHDYSYILN